MRALSPISFLRRSATIYPERTAVVDGDVRLTYAQLWARSRRLAGLLRAAGVQDGDRVAVLAPNSRMLLEAHYGVPMAGAVLVALNIRLTSQELGYIVDHSGVKVLLFDRSLDDLARSLGVRTTLDDEAYERRLLSAEPVMLECQDETSMLAINYTSGTTGRPKGVVYHHRGAHQQALAMAFHGGLSTSTVHLWTLPMFHCNGWCFTWAVTAAGGTHVCLRQVRPSEIWRLIEEEGVSSMNAAPTVLIDMMADDAAAPVSRPVRVGVGGAPPTPTLLGRLTELGFDVVHLYGLTETFGPSVICEIPPELDEATLDQRARFMSRQGNVNIVGSELRVVADGVDVPADGSAVGEVQISGNTVASGYYGDAQATEESFGSGWFRTGDLGVMHLDGYVELKDRSKDVIISGGENISSIEVEQALASHPSVLEVAVVAAPHERWGEVPWAYVSVRPGAAPTADELIVHVRAQLPGFKTPKRIVFGDLPKTSTGKIQKFLLRQQGSATSASEKYEGLE